MSGQIDDIIKVFNQAWMELHCPPARLMIDDEKDDWQYRPKPFFAVNGEVYIKPNIVPKGCDPKEYLLWYFRHELAHVHYCPYDLRTAYSLEKAAYSVIGNWDLAYLATHLFADLQININYLPRRFEEIPYFMKILKSEYSSLLEQILQEVYLQINPIHKPSNKVLENISKELLAVALLDKPWHTKVQMIAIILSKIKTLLPTLLSKRRLEKYLREDTLLVREDFLPSSLKAFEEILGRVSSSSDAEKFYKQWIEPRLPLEEKEKIKKMLEERVKTQRGKLKKGEEKTTEGLGKEGLQGEEKNAMKSPMEPYIGGRQEEPRLPSSLSKPYGEIESKMFNEAFWKRYWYRSRAENVIMQYLSENPTRRPVWAVVKYPDDWYIEDEIEELDIDVSLDEGPLIPEVTTLRWIEEPAFHGQSLVTGFVPSEITILDASLSMSKIHDDAAIAAFIAYLSAYKAGGQTSTITFSTKYVSADWSSPSEMKEMVLSMKFDEYTVFPVYEIRRLVSENPGNCFIVIITDGGWQNIDEAIPILESIADLGHKIVIFLLPGGEYPDKIKLMSRSPSLKIYNVNKPETDLQGLVLAESVKTYRTFLT
ncbi:MAG: hypothetical protein QXK89_02175 [Candidatus Bathyarchaeia archaeon]